MDDSFLVITRAPTRYYLLVHYDSSIEVDIHTHTCPGRVNAEHTSPVRGTLVTTSYGVPYTDSDWPPNPLGDQHSVVEYYVSCRACGFPSPLGKMCVLISPKHGCDTLPYMNPVYTSSTSISASGDCEPIIMEHTTLYSLFHMMREPSNRGWAEIRTTLSVFILKLGVYVTAESNIVSRTRQIPFIMTVTSVSPAALCGVPVLVRRHIQNTLETNPAMLWVLTFGSGYI